MNKFEITIQSKRSGVITTLIDESQIPTYREGGNLTTGIPFTDTIEDSLETAVLVLREAEDFKIEPFDIVRIYDLENSTSKTYIVGGKHSNNDTALHNKREIVINLVEPTKILDTVKIFTLNITDKTLTLREQLNYLLDNCETVVNSQTVRFRGIFNAIPSDLAGEDFFFENTTLRNALDEMLSIVNRRCKVSFLSLDENNNFDTIFITTVSKTSIKDIDFSEVGLTYESSDIEQGNYAGTIKARGYNSITRKPVKVLNEYFTSAGTSVTDKNAIADLHYPIEEIKSFILNNVKATIKGYYTSSDGTGETYIEFPFGAPNVDVPLPALNVDIAERIIEQSMYLLLGEGSSSTPSISENSKRTYLSYQKGSNEIPVSLFYKGFLGLSVSVVNTVIEIVLNSHLEELKEYIVSNQFPGYSGSVAPNYAYLNFPFYLTEAEYLDNEWLENTFTAEIIPRIDTALEIEKANEFDRDVLKMSLMDGQGAKTIDISRHAKHLFSTIERASNEEITLDYAIYSLDNLLPVLGRFKDGIYKDYVIYKREYAVFDRLIKVKYYCSKNYNLIQEKIGVNREYRIFRIPTESNNAPIVVNKKLSFLHLEDNVTVSNTVPKHLLKFFYEIFGISKQVDNASHLFFYTNEARQQRADGTARTLTSSQVFAIPVVNIFANNSIGYLAFPKDNFNVGFSRNGYQVKFWGGGGAQLLYSPYTDNDGKVSQFFLSLGNLKTNANTTQFPIVNISDIVQNEQITVKRQKDRTEKPEFNILTQFKRSQNSNIIFGDLSALFLDSEKTIEIYLDEHKYLDGEVNLSPTATLLSNASFSFVNENLYPYALRSNFVSNGKTVVITHKKRVLVAFNDGFDQKRTIWLSQYF